MKPALKMTARKILETTWRFVVVIIALVGGLFLGAGVLATLKQVRERSDSRKKQLHIV